MPKRPRCSRQEYSRWTLRRHALARMHYSSSDEDSSNDSDNSDRSTNSSHNSEPAPEPFLDIDSNPGSVEGNPALSENEEEERSESGGAESSDNGSYNSSYDSDSDPNGDDTDPSSDGSPEGSSSSETDSEYDDPDPEDEDEEAPLYDGSPITVAESLLSILSLTIAHNLPGTCLQDILELVAMHCPQPNLCRTTIYKFKKFFSTLKLPLERRYYCKVCLTSLETVDELCGQCNARKGVNYFIETPVIPQILALYNRPGFYEKVQNFHNQEHEGRDLEDISDGTVYRSLRDGNLVGEGNKISLMWYTDGVRIFRSSKAELWPFFLTINELPYKDRTKLDNIILAGLWYGSKKPRPSLFLSHIQNELIQLRDGIDVPLPTRNEVIRIQGRVICGSCDLHAKAIFLNTKLFNSMYGCQVCKIQTEPVEPHNHLHRMYPFRRHLDIRTDEETRGFALHAFETGNPFYGIRGPSALCSFVQNPIEWTAVDEMHCVYQGLCKRLGLIWFSEPYEDHAASLRAFVRQVDQRLLAICPPYFVHRRPRSIADHFSWWKASELKYWLLVYSLPIMHDIMPNYLLEHHMLLVMGIFLLSMNKVTQASLDIASRVLTEYVGRFEVIYGRAHMTANLHLLLHLPSNVRKFGPLWTTSCFPMENVNGLLKRLVTGTRFADLQIHTATSMFLNLSTFKTEKLAPGRWPHRFCERLAQPNRRLPLTGISDSLAIVGKCHKANGFPDLIDQAIDDLDLQNPNIYVFQRLFNFKLKILFSSASYTRASKSNSTCVKFNHNGLSMFGVVLMFIRVTECDCEVFCQNCQPQYYAIIQECRTVHAFRAIPGGFLPFIHRCTMVENYLAVAVEGLICVNFFISLEDVNSTFIVEPVNLLEVE